MPQSYFAFNKEYTTYLYSAKMLSQFFCHLHLKKQIPQLRLREMNHTNLILMRQMTFKTQIDGPMRVGKGLRAAGYANTKDCNDWHHRRQ